MIRDKIVKLAKDLSLECEMEEIEELLDKESEELTNEDLIELEEEKKVAEEERREAAAEKEEEEEPQRMFTTKGLAEGLSQLNKLFAHFEGMDPNIERFSRIERMVLDAFRPYQEIYEEKKRTIQTKLNMFIKKHLLRLPVPPAITPTIPSQPPADNNFY